jgi:hypothetical protein
LGLLTDTIKYSAEHRPAEQAPATEQSEVVQPTDVGLIDGGRKDRMELIRWIKAGPTGVGFSDQGLKDRVELIAMIESGEVSVKEISDLFRDSRASL